jgi:CheY-like chemotaxis protein
LHFNDVFDRPTANPTSGVEDSADRLYDPVGGEREGDPVKAEQPLRGFVVLVVEDDVDSLDTIHTLISTALGCEVLRASTGVEALAIIDGGERVDLVFSDIMMPGMDGLTLTDEIRKRNPGIPTVLATGLTTMLEAAIEHGAIALVKPYTLDQLSAVFREHLC